MVNGLSARNGHPVDLNRASSRFIQLIGLLSVVYLPKDMDLNVEFGSANPLRLSELGLINEKKYGQTRDSLIPQIQRLRPQP